jgi:hypothetical protein
MTFLQRYAPVAERLRLRAEPGLSQHWNARTVKFRVGSAHLEMV